MQIVPRFGIQRQKAFVHADAQIRAMFHVVPDILMSKRQISWVVFNNYFLAERSTSCWVASGGS